MTLRGDDSGRPGSVKGKSSKSALSHTCRAEPDAHLLERLLRQGAHGLTDGQILEILLGYTMAPKDVRTVAGELLREFGSLRGVLTASAVELGHVAHMDSRQIGLIRLAGEIASRLADSGQGLQRMLDDSSEL